MAHMKSKSIESAVVLAAGLGTRMRPITNTIPKPLVSVNGKALLDHALDALGEVGVRQASVNVHYLPEQIEAHIATREQPFCQVSDERNELLDSGGGVKKASRLFKNAPFFILNADSFWVDGPTSNLDAMGTFWDEDTTDMLLLVAAKDDAVGFDGAGDFFMADDGTLTRRGDADSAPYVYAGAIIAKQASFAAIEEDKFSLNQMFDDAISKGRLFGMQLNGLWLHVGTPDAIPEAEFAITRYQQTAV